MVNNNILNEQEMNKTITIAECRKLREVMNTLTAAPILTKQEYIRLMVVFDHVLARLEGKIENDR